jgi:serine O-acetyltransferase
MVQAIHSLLDHAAATDDRLRKLIEHLQHEGVDCSDAKATADRFDPAQLNRLLE